MTARKKISTAPPEERVEAEVVSDDYEPQPSDEVVAAGEHISEELLEGADLVLPAPSVANNPYVPEEEQGMEMRPTVLGPPAFGSPDPITSVGRLVALSTHPLAAESLPEGHPAALSEDFGEGYDGTLKGDATITTAPVAPQTTTTGEEDAEGDDFNATAGAVELAEAEGVDLNEVEGTGADGRITKGDVETYIEGQNP